MSRRNMIGLNLVVMLVYGFLYFLVSDEYETGFPVQLAVYITVHGIGLLILSMVQKALRDKILSRTFLLAGFAVLGLGWTLVYTVF